MFPGYCINLTPSTVSSATRRRGFTGAYGFGKTYSCRWILAGLSVEPSGKCVSYRNSRLDTSILIKLPASKRFGQANLPWPKRELVVLGVAKWWRIAWPCYFLLL